MNLFSQLPNKNPNFGAFPPGSVVSLVGGGGKTSALCALARCQNRPTLITTTTKVGQSQISSADARIRLDEFFAKPGQALDQNVTWVSDLVQLDGTSKIGGVPEAEMTRLIGYAQALGLTVLIEADGAKRRAIKAPEAHEPVVPSESNFVIACIGLSVLDRPATEETVHRLPRYLSCVGGNEGDPIEESAILKLIAHPNGSFKSTPEHAEKILLLNQADTPELSERAIRLGKSALSAGVDRAWVACLKLDEFLYEIRK